MTAWWPCARRNCRVAAAHLVLPLNHTGLVVAPGSIRQVVHFLNNGRFAEIGSKQTAADAHRACATEAAG